jgi:hypothetical protein
MHLRSDKCLHTWTPKPMREIPVRRYSAVWTWWGGLRDKTRSKSSKCLPTSPTGIIRYVFPASTEDAALRVAYCETGGTFNIYAHNPSGASGLFQLMPTWWQGKFNPYNPWANTRAAYSISSAGTNWGAWVCQP